MIHLVAASGHMHGGGGGGLSWSTEYNFHIKGTCFLHR